MAAVANNPTFAKKVGVPQSVGQDFSKADKGRKFSKGGDTMASKMNAGFMAMMAKKKGAPAKKMAGGGITTAKMGTVKTAAPSKDGMATKGKTKGTMVKMSGSKPLGMKSGGKTC
jgi:DNA uptake protein ComE-like DNA-binding protein